jgi:hypothetical protein
LGRNNRNKESDETIGHARVTEVCSERTGKNQEREQRQNGAKRDVAGERHCVVIPEPQHSLAKDRPRRAPAMTA